VARSSPHADHSTSTAMAIENAGSTQFAPHTTTPIPAAIAATDPAASTAMCTKAPCMFRLPPRARASSTALPRFTARPSAATTSNPPPRTSTGSPMRRIAS